MSDKETAPPPYEPAFGDPSFWPVLLSHVMGGSIRQLASAEKMVRAQVECTAPAPQPADEIVAGLLLRGIEYCAELADEGTPWESVAEPEPQYFATFLEAYDFQIELAAPPQVTPELELEQEAAGRWIAEFNRFPGVIAYGATEEEAMRNAARVLIESEQASPTPDKCPRCHSADRSGHITAWAGLEPVYCQDSWHSSASTPKGTE